MRGKAGSHLDGQGHGDHNRRRAPAAAAPVFARPALASPVVAALATPAVALSARHQPVDGGIPAVGEEGVAQSGGGGSLSGGGRAARGRRWAGAAGLWHAGSRQRASSSAAFFLTRRQRRKSHPSPPAACRPCPADRGQWQLPGSRGTATGNSSPCQSRACFNEARAHLAIWFGPRGIDACSTPRGMHGQSKASDTPPARTDSPHFVGPGTIQGVST